MSNVTVEQNTSSHSDVNLSELKISNFASLNSFLIDELEVNLSINLSDDLKNIIKTYLSEYESLNQRKLEEKDSIISQLKQSLLDLTEKRFRTAIQNGSNSLPYENIEFLINEKESKISQLLDQLSENERDLNKLKQTIKSQDDVILSLNNNIYELKNNNQTVLKAKQESFKLMNDDLSSKQKLIDEQSETIRDLSEKTRRLEDELEKAHKDLEKRLNEKQTDLQIKIAQFEANLREGKTYFEDVLAEKTNEINRLRQKLENLGQEGDDEAFNSDKSNQLCINKYDSDNIKNIKALYEHQIDILKVKIEMLEKTCSNYQQGIKEMNKNFGIKQLSDEVNSIQTFKDLMQDLQKTNVNLETEKIDLQVNNSKLQSQLEQTRLEKENLNKKFQTVDQLNQRLGQEKVDQETHYRTLLDSKEAQLSETSQRVESLSAEFDLLSQENLRLQQISLEHDQLKIANQELAAHYEQLCQQATDIVNGNQILNDQVEANQAQIEQLKSQVNDLNLQIDHLTNCNSELNTQKVNYELRVEDLELKLKEIEPELDELEALRRLKLDTESINEQLKELKIEIDDKNELIDQLNQAKEFLAENNSKLLTNNIKIQLFVESLGLDQSEIENNQRVKEYDDLVDKLSRYENEILALRIKLEELNATSEKIGLHKETQFDNLSQEIDELKNRLENNDKMTLKLKAKLKQMLKKSTINQEKEAQTEDVCDEDDKIQYWMNIGAKMTEEKIENEVKQSLNALKFDVECLLLSRALKSDKSLNTSQDFDYRDQIVNLEAQLNDKLNQIAELNSKYKEQTNDSVKASDNDDEVNKLRIKIEQLQQDIRIKDEQIDALSDWNSSSPTNEETKGEKEALELKVKQLNEGIEVLREENRKILLNLEKTQIDLNQEIDNAKEMNQTHIEITDQLENRINVKDQEIVELKEHYDAKINCLNEENQNLVSNFETEKKNLIDQLKNLNETNEKYLFTIGEHEMKIKQLENELKIKEEQIEAVSDWSNIAQNKSENEDQVESLKHQILDLQVELKAKLELVESLELKLKTTDQELDTIKCNYKYLEDQLSQINLQEKETKLEKVQLLGNSTTNDESIELKAQINQIMIDLSIKNEQLTSLENFLNEQKIESQKMYEKLNFESENWKKKYESMRLKALAFRDKSKKLELTQCLEDGRASPSNSSKSSMDSSSLAEHLFHNLQAEYKEFKKSHEDQIIELNAQLLSLQNEFNQYKIDYNEDKIRAFLLSIEALEKEKNELILNFEQLSDKYSHIEKQNLKLKAKLKQMMAKGKEETIDVQKPTTAHMQTQTCVDFVSVSNQTDDDDENETEILRIENEQFKCKIEMLEKNQFTDDIKSELDELKEKIKTFQDQNLKLKAKLKQLMSLNQKIKVDFECQTNLETKEPSECDVLLNKIANIEEALANKKKMNDELMNELNEMKESIEKQRIEYENQINSLNQELENKESNLVQIKEELCGLRSQSEVSMVSGMPNGLMSESLVLDETASTSSSNLDNQLKFCHEKCEKVVAKLSLLRKQNESLNSKIRTIKSMIAS